jgi:YD repeat-containing protein
LLSDGVRSYSYDPLHRLTQVVSGTLTTTFTYDGDGNRVGKSVNGQATSYLLDPVVPLPVVISDSAAVYLYGLDIIARQQGGIWSYYQHDGLRQMKTPRMPEVSNQVK